MKAYDVFGQELKIGDIITYPVRHSSVMHIRVALIKDIVPYQYDQYHGTREGVKLKVLVASSNYNLTEFKAIPAEVFVLSRVIRITDIQTNNDEIQFLREVQKSWEPVKQPTNNLNQ